MVTGNTRRYSQSLEKINKVVDARPGERMFGLNMVINKGKTVFIADTSVNEYPSSEQLADIAISSAPNGSEGYMFWQGVGQGNSDSNSERQTMSMVIEDLPNTTNVVTYKTQLLGFDEQGICINPLPARQGPAPVFSGMTIFEIKS